MGLGEITLILLGAAIAIPLLYKLVFIGLGILAMVGAVLTALWRVLAGLAHLVGSLVGLGPKTELRDESVYRIVDGDTLEAGPRRVRVRIPYIDAPEAGQPARRRVADAGAVARRNLVELIDSDRVRLACIGHDDYGRELCQVFIDEVDIGLAMVEDGMAIALPDAPASYHEAERIARENRTGLWAHGGFEDPAQFRAALENDAPHDAPA